MRELSLNILDIAENSVKAGAALVEIEVEVLTAENRLSIRITDDGCGMDREFLRKVCDPFTTTRTTRKVGMGIPLFRMAAEMAGGEFRITSEKGVGTEVFAGFVLDHIDRPPLGNLADTMTAFLSESAVNGGKPVEFVLTYRMDGREFRFDTRELRKELDGVPSDAPEVLQFVRQLLEENINELNGGLEI